MPQADERTPAQVIRDFKVIRELRAQMVRDGMVNGDATPEQMVAKLREIVPHDLLRAPSHK